MLLLTYAYWWSNRAKSSWPLALWPAHHLFFFVFLRGWNPGGEKYVKYRNSINEIPLLDTFIALAKEDVFINYYDPFCVLLSVLKPELQLLPTKRAGHVHLIVQVHLFHDLLLSPISQHSDCSELTCHNSLHCDQAWSQFTVWTPAAIPPHSENNSAI